MKISNIFGDPEIKKNLSAIEGLVKEGKRIEGEWKKIERRM
jgi:hypothetical protein